MHVCVHVCVHMCMHACFEASKLSLQRILMFLMVASASECEELILGNSARVDQVI